MIKFISNFHRLLPINCLYIITYIPYSGKHCSVTVDKNSGAFTIIDLSTNGTFVNGKKIPKGEPSKLETGDKVYFLNDEAENTKVGFIFVQKYHPKDAEIGKKRCKLNYLYKEELILS